MCNSFSTKTLEVEIIVYRHLLDCSAIAEQVVITPQPVGSEMTERFLVQSETKRQGSIGISKCEVTKKMREMILFIYFFL